MRAAFAAMGAEPPGLRLACTNVVPARARPRLVVGRDRRPGCRLARGLVAGRPAAARRRGRLPAGRRDRGPPGQRGAGLLRRLRDLRARRRRLLRRAVRRRPADQRRRVRAARPARRPSSPAGCCRPRSRTPTRPPTPAVRRCWSPPSRGQPEHLLRATRDFLHQEYRRPAMPASLDLVDALRARRRARRRVRRRADGARVHRAGDGRRRPLAERCPEAWEAHHLEVDTDGVRVG